MQNTTTDLDPRWENVKLVTKSQFPAGRYHGPSESSAPYVIEFYGKKGSTAFRYYAKHLQVDEFVRLLVAQVEPPWQFYHKSTISCTAICMEMLHTVKV